MKISEIFRLNKTQHELDFVDINPNRDKPVFLDPFFISTRKHPWCSGVSRTIRSFFQFAIDLINAGELDRARGIFVNLNEPNETCLGFSKTIPRGRGVGEDDSQRIFDSILESGAVETGLVEDLEDTAIFIDGIDKDKVSDMTTNIIKRHLVEYTQTQCELWGIPLERDVPSGYYWNEVQREWDNSFSERLVINGKPLLLVPKIAVSFYKEYIGQKYHQHFVLSYLQGEHLAKNSGLVRERTLKDGTKRRYVTKKDIKEKEAPYSKDFLREFTRKYPEVFKNFRSDREKTVMPIKGEVLETIDLFELVDHVEEKLTSIKVGPEEAEKYHKLMVGILEFIFYPRLTNPQKEKEINEGRKRIDISFDNSASQGFFHRLHDIHEITSRYVLVECKNYSEDPKNPELDQLAGRFSANTGKFGLLLCRKIDNTKLFIKRCIDLWKQKKELIIPITDEDIISLLHSIKRGSTDPAEELLTKFQRDIILS